MMLATFPNLAADVGRPRVAARADGAAAARQGRAHRRRRAARGRAGVDGIVVSNHGGRQVDGAVASLDALVEVRAARRRGRCSSTAASAAAPTSSRRSRSAPTRCCSAGRTRTASPSAGRRASGGDRATVAETDLTLALARRRTDVASSTGRGSRRRSRASRAARARGARGRRAGRRARCSSGSRRRGVCHTDLHVLERPASGIRCPCCSGTRAPASSRRSARASGAAPSASVSCSAGARRAASAAGVPARRRAPLPASAALRARRLRARRRRSCSRRSSSGTFATRTVVHEAAAIRFRGELPAEQACLIGCAVATGVGSVLETARSGKARVSRVIGCGAVGLSACRARASPVRPRSTRSTSTSGSSSGRARFGATADRPGRPARLRLRRRRPAGDGRAGPRDARPRAERSSTSAFRSRAASPRSS